MADVDLDKLKVLVVEDNEATSKTISSILSAGVSARSPVII